MSAAMMPMMGGMTPTSGMMPSMMGMPMGGMMPSMMGMPTGGMMPSMMGMPMGGMMPMMMCRIEMGADGTMTCKMMPMAGMSKEMFETCCKAMMTMMEAGMPCMMCCGGMMMMCMPMKAA